MSRENEATGEVLSALEEARDAFNAAKREGRQEITLTRRSLYLLTMGACIGYGISVHDVQTGEQIHDPDPPDPRLN